MDTLLWWNRTVPLTINKSGPHICFVKTCHLRCMDNAVVRYASHDNRIISAFRNRVNPSNLLAYCIGKIAGTPVTPRESLTGETITNYQELS